MLGLIGIPLAGASATLATRGQKSIDIFLRPETQKPAQLADTYSRQRVANDHLLPYRFKQRRFGYEPTRMLDEVMQDLERFSP
jgi:hypothetical protein